MPGANGQAWHTLTADRVLSAEMVDEQQGLSSSEAASRAGQFGPNTFATGKAESRWHAFIRQFAIGLGYGRAEPGLMERRPRQPDRPILPRDLMIWLISVGLVIGVGTLGVISWAEQERTQAVAHTMGVVTFSLFSLFFSIATKDERRTVFSLDTFADKTFNISTPLDVQQWIICIAVSLSIIVISEIRKALKRRAAPAARDTGGAEP